MQSEDKDVVERLREALTDARKDQSDHTKDDAKARTFLAGVVDGLKKAVFIAVNLRSQGAAVPEESSERTQQILDDAATAIKIHDGVLRQKKDIERWRSQYFAARDALYQFNYPPDPRLLREIADEIDCGTDCEHGSTEWDTDAHNCSREDRAEGCAAQKASCLREFAKAVEVRNMLSASPVPPKQDGGETT